MLRTDPYQKNYSRLERLMGQPLGKLKSERSYRLRSDRGFMDLVVEKLLPCPETGAMVLSLAHYFVQNGDLCQDPEMTVRVFLPDPSAPSGHPGMIEALTFQQAFPPLFRVVYPEPGCVDVRLKRELNDFLTTWLRSLKDQAHQPVMEDP